MSRRRSHVFKSTSLEFPHPASQKEPSCVTIEIFFAQLGRYTHFLMGVSTYKSRKLPPGARYRLGILLPGKKRKNIFSEKSVISCSQDSRPGSRERLFFKVRILFPLWYKDYEGLRRQGND
ncbi:MAG: hypothetical protein D3916_10345 [Candidatus Electrothrix sp. MAN1_4]|nr:hypothetical protein [Candidatus Electrothrix sp. MAN1_4]